MHIGLLEFSIMAAFALAALLFAATAKKGSSGSSSPRPNIL